MRVASCRPRALYAGVTFSPLPVTAMPAIFARSLLFLRRVDRPSDFNALSAESRYALDSNHREISIYDGKQGDRW